MNQIEIFRLRAEFFTKIMKICPLDGITVLLENIFADGREAVRSYHQGRWSPHVYDEIECFFLVVDMLADSNKESIEETHDVIAHNS